MRPLLGSGHDGGGAGKDGRGRIERLPDWFVKENRDGEENRVDKQIISGGEYGNNDKQDAYRELENKSGSKINSLDTNALLLDADVVHSPKHRHHLRDAVGTDNIAQVLPSNSENTKTENTQNIPIETPPDSVTDRSNDKANSLPKVFILVQNDTESLRILIQKTIEKMFDRLEAHILFHDVEVPDSGDMASTSHDSSSRHSWDNPASNGEFEEMLVDERLSAWQQHIEQSYQHVLSILLEATSLQTIPENLEFWKRVYAILENSNYLSRTKRSPRRGRRRRPGYRYRARFLKHMRRQLMINYGHVTPCAWKDRFYCMNGGTCVMIGDLDIKTCR